MDNDSNIVTKLDLTSGNVFDGTYFKELVDNKSQTITADKAHDNNENHTYLKKHNIKSAIIVKRNRIKKEIIKNSKLISIQTSQRQRPNIERKFAELKNLHGLSKARYWGLSKVYIQSCLSAIAVNIKRIVRLLFDIPLFNPIGLVSLNLKT
jgi:IS5 family transposase